MPSWLLRAQIICLDLGLLLSLYTGYRICAGTRGIAGNESSYAWAILILLLFALGIWIFFQPMQMRGTIPRFGESMCGKPGLIALLAIARTGAEVPGRWRTAEDTTFRARDGHDARYLPHRHPCGVGLADISMLVQDAETGRPLPGCRDRTDRLSSPAPATATPYRATTEAATNKLFQAARLDLPTPGAGTWKWMYPFQPQGSRAHSRSKSRMRPPPWLEMSPWFGWPLLVIGAFVFQEMRAETQVVGWRRSGFRTWEMSSSRPSNPGTAARSESTLTTVQLPSENATAAIMISICCMSRPIRRACAAMRRILRRRCGRKASSGIC